MTALLSFNYSFVYPSKYESISPLDDLAFDMYQDPEVAHIIRLLDQKKQDMVQQGNNERSKNLKQAIADLQKVPSPSGVLHDEVRCPRGSVIRTANTIDFFICVSHLN